MYGRHPYFWHITILSKTENINQVLKEKPLDLDALKNLSKAEKNAKILNYFENLRKDGKLGKEQIDNMIAKITLG